MKRKLLLVDEDQLVLKALMRSLRKLKDHWDVLYAQSPQEALAHLDSNKIDVLITEVRLTKADSELFLRSFLKQQPQASRIVLTGYTDPNAIFKYAGLAHQLLSKPWEDSTLMETIRRADLISDLLLHDHLRKALNRIECFPGIPAVYVELTEKLQSADTAVQDVGDIIIRDPGLTLKLLQIVNSPYYGLAMPVNDPKKAVALLGLDIVKGFVLSSGVFNQYENRPAANLSIEALWQHSLKIANIVKQIGKAENLAQEICDTSFIAGLLHDIGKIIIAVNFPVEFENARSRSASERLPVWQAEQQVLGASHAEIGAYLLCLWGLPLSVIQAVQYHHSPRIAEHPQVDHTTLLHIADAMLNAMENPSPTPGVQWDAAYIARLQLSERVALWQQRINDLA